MYYFLRSFLFLFSAEKAHYLAMDLFCFALKIPFLKKVIINRYSINNQESITMAGITFPNSIGLAAGFDKNAKWLHTLQILGFGHIEIGTVTPLPQAGNNKPRLFRLKKDQALINRMGFNNDGIDTIAERLKTRPKNLIVGGNIGKNKITPNENAINDYIICFEKIYAFVDYIAINVSSPNTPGLRALQDKTFLNELFVELNLRRKNREIYKPIFLKIAPDLEFSAVDEIIEVITNNSIDGIIATNTTIDRSNLSTPKDKIELIGAGGLSGKPLTNKSTKIIGYLKKNLPANYPIIGVGGVFNHADFVEKKQAGSSLVQVYTGFIYEGPGIVKKILST